MNTFTVITLFPALIDAFTGVGIVRRARERGSISVETIDPRAFAAGPHGQVDDAPYGGGPGMVMMVEPLRRAIAAARARSSAPAAVAYLSPQGPVLNQRRARELTAVTHLVLVAGRYEGIDERVIERDIDFELSLGDFVLSGGEIAAMAVIDAVTRLLPGALGSALSAQQDSFADGLLKHPQYTRPEVIDGQAVPGVLLGGNHAAIARWRRRQALANTLSKRPDLLEKIRLGDDDEKLLAEIRRAPAKKSD